MVAIALLVQAVAAPGQPPPQLLNSERIAANFGTTEATVKEQRARLMRKMAAASAAELVHMSIKLGVAGPAPSASEGDP